MPRLTQAELDEAAVKRDAVILASQAIIRARNAIDSAVAGKINQRSQRWDRLCNALETAIARHSAATGAEVRWWRSRGFNV